MSNCYQPPKDFLELLNAMADDLLTEDQQHRLAAILRQDAQARSYYVEFQQLVGSLQWEYAEAARHQTETTEGIRIPKQASGFHSQHWLPYLLVVALLLAVNGGLFWWLGLSRPNETDATTVAVIATTNHATWQEPEAYRVGQRLSCGTYSLVGGAVDIRFDNGAVVKLSGPAQLHIESGQYVKLLSGKARVVAPKEAIGFTIRTEAANITDLGTEFGVVVNADRSSEIHVFDGVVVARPTASGAVIPLLQTEAARIDAEHGDVVSVSANDQLFPHANHHGKMAVEATKAYLPISPAARIVFVGDQTTDRETHLLLLREAFKALPQDQRPLLFNAGVTCKFRLQEQNLQETVLSLKPTHVVLEFGTDLAVADSPLSAESFRRHLLRWIDRLQNAKVEPILRTGHPLGPMHAESCLRLRTYNDIITQVAQHRNLRLGNTDRFFPKDRLDILLASNGWVPTFAGHQGLARTLLEALGYSQLEIPDTLPLGLLPGVVTDWRYKLVAKGQTHTPDDLQQWQANDNWRTLTIPQAEDKLLRRYADISHTITYRDRARGFATDLHHDPDQNVLAQTVLHCKSPRQAILNTGATLKRIWLNGKLVFENPYWTGWHAKKEQIPVTLGQGDNQIVIEAHNSFFFSVTDASE